MTIDDFSGMPVTAADSDTNPSGDAGTSMEIIPQTGIQVADDPLSQMTDSLLKVKGEVSFLGDVVNGKPVTVFTHILLSAQTKDNEKIFQSGEAVEEFLNTASDLDKDGKLNTTELIYKHMLGNELEATLAKTLADLLGINEKDKGKDEPKKIEDESEDMETTDSDEEEAYQRFLNFQRESDAQYKETMDNAEKERDQKILDAEETRKAEQDAADAKRDEDLADAENRKEESLQKNKDAFDESSQKLDDNFEKDKQDLQDWHAGELNDASEKYVSGELSAEEYKQRTDDISAEHSRRNDEMTDNYKKGIDDLIEEKKEADGEVYKQYNDDKEEILGEHERASNAAETKCEESKSSARVDYYNTHFEANDRHMQETDANIQQYRRDCGYGSNEEGMPTTAAGYKPEENDAFKSGPSMGNGGLDM